METSTSHRNEVYAIIIRDRLEEMPFINGEFNLIDTNSLESSEVSLTKDVAKEYQKLIEEHDNKIKEHFIDNQIKFGKIYTDEDIYLRLLEIVKG